MNIEHKGYIYPKVWDIATRIVKLRSQRELANLGSSSMSVSIYLVQFPQGTKKVGNYFFTPNNVRIYQDVGDQYNAGILISELDDANIREKYFNDKSP